MQFGPAITSKANERVKTLRAAFSGKAAKPGEIVGLEGEHLIAEALRSGLSLETVFVRVGSEHVLAPASLKGLQAKQIMLLSEAVFDGAVETEAPQGIAATLAIPAPRKAGGLDLVLVLESLRDPGNVGTLLRSAEAFGASMVMMTEDCANPWNSKVMRASAGSVFRVPMMRAKLETLHAQLKELGIRVLAAVVNGEDVVSLLDVDLRAKTAVMIGNEGAGLSEKAIALADTRVMIPCLTESLNAAVAGSTFLYEAMRQRLAVQL